MTCLLSRYVIHYVVDTFHLNSNCFQCINVKACCVFNRIIYFGGYGHKLLSEINNPGTFIVDEASWVMYQHIIQIEANKYLVVSTSFSLFKAEDIFWGWNSEVHVFDPGSKGWTEPQTFVRHTFKHILCDIVLNIDNIYMSIQFMDIYFSLGNQCPSIISYQE